MFPFLCIVLAQHSHHKYDENEMSDSYVTPHQQAVASEELAYLREGIT